MVGVKVTAGETGGEMEVVEEEGVGQDVVSERILGDERFISRMGTYSCAMALIATVEEGVRNRGLEMRR